MVTDSIRELFDDTFTAALRSIFDESYEFKIQINEQKSRHTAQFLIKNAEYRDFKDIEYTQGKCLREVVGFIAMVIMTCLDKDLENVIVVDEPFSGAEEERKPAIGEFLRTIIEDFGVQIVLFTHSAVYENYADNVVKL